MNQLQIESVNLLLKQYEREPEHVRHVTRLALELYDQLTELHGLGSRERELLEAAALLHDIGWSQSATAHHKASQKLILGAELAGWSDEEKLIIANIARYHRKSSPKLKHRKFAQLSDQNKQVVLKLAAILRVADSLDRSHNDVVEKIICHIDHDLVRLEVFCRYDLGFELYAFEKKRGMFSEVFGLDILIDSVRNINVQRQRHE